MKIIGFERKSNAGTVYSKYISGYKDVVFGFDYDVAEPSGRACNRYWSKDDMKDRKVPCIIARLSNDDYCDDFEYISQDDKAVRYYFGDKMEPEND